MISDGKFYHKVFIFFEDRHRKTNNYQQQQQYCIYLKKYKVYNTLCPANSYNANLGRTRLKLNKDVIKLHKKKKKRKEIQ